MATVANLQVQIGATIKGLEGSLKKAESSLNTFAKNATAIGGTLSKSLTVPLVGFATASVFAFDKQVKAIAQVEQAIKSTGGVAGRTSKELQDMASSLQKNSLFGDEEILQKVTAQLLTFTNIAGTAFDRTQQAALDLATRLGGDLQGASIQLGKALNDPVANLSALSRAGIQFSKDQKELINSLIETGRLAEAQTVILDELETQFGGSAKAAADAGIGGITQLKNSFGDLMEQIGEVIVEAINPFVDRLKEIVAELQKTDKETLQFYVALGAIVAVIGPLVVGLGILAKAIVVVSTAFAFLVANPYVLVAAGVLLLIGHYTILINKINRTNKLLNAPFDETLPINEQLDIAIQRLKALDERYTKLRKNEGIGTTSEAGLKAQQGQIANAKLLLDLERDRVARLIEQKNAINETVNSNIANNEIVNQTLTTVKSINDELEINQQKIDAILNINGTLSDQQLLELVTLTSINDSLTNQIKQREELVRLAIAQRNVNLGRDTDLIALPDTGGLRKQTVDSARYAESMGVLGSKIKQVSVDMTELDFTSEQTGTSIDVLSEMANQFTDAFAQGLTNVLLKVDSINDALKNFGKMLLSAAIQKGISILLTGGLSGTGLFGSQANGGGGGILGSLFGGKKGVRDALITSSGKVIEFSPKDNILAMQDFGNLGGSGKADNSKIDELINIGRKTFGAIMPLNATLKNIGGAVAGDKVVNVGAPSVTVNVPEQPPVVVNPPPVVVNPPPIVVNPPNVDFKPPDVNVFPNFTIPGLESFNRIPDILVNFVDTVANFGNNVGLVPSMSQQTLNVVVSGQLVGDGSTLYAVIKNAERNYR